MLASIKITEIVRKSIIYMIYKARFMILHDFIVFLVIFMIFHDFHIFSWFFLIFMILYDFIWFYMIVHDFIWFLQFSYVFLWFFVMFKVFHDFSEWNIIFSGLKWIFHSLSWFRLFCFWFSMIFQWFFRCFHTLPLFLSLYLIYFVILMCYHNFSRVSCFLKIYIMFCDFEKNWFSIFCVYCMVFHIFLQYRG